MSLNECPDCGGKGYRIAKDKTAEVLYRRVECKRCKGTGMLLSIFKKS